MREPTLSTRQLNRALLARQLLLDRSALAIADALEHVGGLQAQYAPSAYIGLWTRLRGFRRQDLTDQLTGRGVVQATLMRSTIHLVSAHDFWLFAAGTRDARREWWLRVERGHVDGLDMELATRRVLELLRGHPRRHGEMLELLGAEGIPRLGWVGAGHFLDLVRVPPSGTWEQRRADLYGLAEEWLGPAPAAAAAEAGIDHLVRRYLAGFGPAPLADVALWAGVPPAKLRGVEERLDLRRYRDETGRGLLDLPGGVLPDPGAPAPVRFLPTWDATLLAHARRTGILPERYRPLVFNTRTPHSVPTFLVDGAVAGTWHVVKGRVELAPFEPLDRPTARAVEDEAVALADFHAD